MELRTSLILRDSWKHHLPKYISRSLNLIKEKDRLQPERVIGSVTQVQLQRINFTRRGLGKKETNDTRRKILRPRDQDLALTKEHRTLSPRDVK